MGLMKLLSAGKSLVGIREGRSKYKVTKSGLLPNFNESGEPAISARTTKSGFGRKAGKAANPFQTAEANADERTERLLLLPQGVEEPREETEPDAEAPKAGLVGEKGEPAVADAPAAAGAQPAEVQPRRIQLGAAAVKGVEQSKPQRRPKSSGAVRDVAEVRHRSEPVLTAVERKRTPKSALVARLGKLAALAQPGRRKPGPKSDEAWLRKLKVVRNDLKDADLEVVPARGAEEVTEKSSAGTKPKPARGAVARFVRSRKLSRLVSACFAWF